MGSLRARFVWKLALCLLLPSVAGQRFLSVEGGELRLNGEKVFMSGMNIAWQDFGRDFGSGRYDCCTKTALEDYLQRISDNGGNSIRIWLHCDARMTPQFDSGGYVTGTDDSNTMISDLTQFLDKAKQVNILVFLVLWNGAEPPTDKYRDLLWDDSKLQSYIDNALVPMVAALKDHVSLGGWSVMNEPEGIVQPGQTDANACFDTRPLSGSGAGWAGIFVPMYNLLRFINKQNAAIKEQDPKALTTIGSWTEKAQTDNFGFRNYYTDSCLTAAGGEASGIIDFQEIHNYVWDGVYNPTSPLIITKGEFGLSKPTIIGEFSQDGGDGRDITVYMDWAYSQGYSGAWTWQANGGGHHSDDFDTQARGTAHLEGRNDPSQGGRVDIVLQ